MFSPWNHWSLAVFYQHLWCPLWKTRERRNIFKSRWILACNQNQPFLLWFLGFLVPYLKYTIVYTHLKWHEVKCTSRLLEVASLPLRWRPWNVWKSQRIRRKTPWRVVLLGWRHRVDFLGKDDACSHSNSRLCYYVVNASCRTRFVKHFMFILLGSNMWLYIHIQICIYGCFRKWWYPPNHPF